MSFRDTFTRDESETNLQYDDTASYFYFATLLMVIIVPLAYNIVKHILKALRPNDSGVNTNAPLSKDLLNAAGELTKKHRFSGGFILKVIILIMLVLLLKTMVNRATSDRRMKGFDPWEILEIERQATDKEIRKAYRTLTLKYHPDKNPDDPLATAKFMIITKAYECLKNEKARENCEKFGSADGSGSMHVAIALPSFLVQKGNQIAVLIIVFFILLVVIPGSVYYWYEESNKYDEHGNLKDSFGVFLNELNENTTSKNCPSILAWASEFKDIPCSGSQVQDLQKINAIVEEKQTLGKIDPRIRKHACLMLAQMMRIPVPASLQKDFLFIQNRAQGLISGLIELAMQITMRRIMKPLGLRCVDMIIDFSQFFYQGMWTTDHPLKQLKSLDESNLDKVVKRAKKMPKFWQLIHMPVDERKIFSVITEDPLRDQINAELDAMPKMSFKAEFLGDADDLAYGEIVTLNITITRENFADKGKGSGMMTSAVYPFLKQEKWYVMIVDKERNAILWYKLIVMNKKKHEIPFIFPADRAGKMQLTVSIRSDCYRELDYEQVVPFEILPQPKTKREAFVHPEDKELDKIPSLWQQMLQGTTAKVNESDDEEEEEEEPAGDGKEKESKKKTKEKDADVAVVKHQDDDEVEEEEEEH